MQSISCLRSVNLNLFGKYFKIITKLSSRKSQFLCGGFSPSQCKDRRKGRGGAGNQLNHFDSISVSLMPFALKMGNR